MIERKQVATPEGQLSFLHRPGSGTPVVFLHGMTNAATAWPPFFDAVSPRPCFALDFPGHGQSDRWPRYHFDVDRDAVLALLDTLDQPGVLVGHSMGGLAACAAAALHPDLVAGLYLEDVTPLFLDNPDRRNYVLLPGVFSIPGLVDRMHTDGLPVSWLAEQMGMFAHDQHHTVADALTADAIADWAEQASHLDPGRWERSSADPPGISPSDQLRRYQGPIHVAHGDLEGGSIVDPAELEQMRLLNPKTTATCFPAAGHLLHSQCTEAFTQDLARVGTATR